MVLSRHEKAEKIIHAAREVYENHDGDGAWLAMERAYLAAISAATQDAFDLGFRAAGGTVGSGGETTALGQLTRPENQK